MVLGDDGETKRRRCAGRTIDDTSALPHTRLPWIEPMPRYADGATGICVL